jgi:hypothetical protein
MHGPAGIRVLEYIPAARWLGWVLGRGADVQFQAAALSTQGLTGEDQRLLLNDPLSASIDEREENTALIIPKRIAPSSHLALGHIRWDPTARFSIA